MRKLYIIYLLPLVILWVTVGSTLYTFARGNAEDLADEEDNNAEYQIEYIQESDSSAVRAPDENTPSMDSIIANLEKNQLYEGLKSIGAIIVKDQFGERTTEFVLQSKGSDYSLLEFTSIAEKGQKTLRIEDKIYLYYPDAERVVTLNQSMFQQSILDSDISYEDMSGDRSISETYEATLEGLEMKDGHDTYRVYLSAYNDRGTTYPYQRIWIRRDTFTLQASELFTRSKKLRKVSQVDAIQEVAQGRYMITNMIFFDVLKADSSTTIILDDIVITSLDNRVFSVENLKF